MIGSISKVRPCGHHHYYKYAHIKTNSSKVAGNTNNKFYFVERDYLNDIYDDNCWGPFSLENATSIIDCTFEDGKFTKFKAQTPNLSNANFMFTADNGRPSPAVVDFQIDYDKLTACASLFYGFRIKELPKNFNPITRNFYHIFGGGCGRTIANAHGGTFPYYQIINEATNSEYLFRSVTATISDEYTFENVEQAKGMFFSDGDWNCVKKCPSNLSFKKVQSINGSFYNCDAPTFTTFQTTDEMVNLTNADSAFHGCSHLSTLYPNYDSFSLPKLSTAANMFNKCILDKKSTIKLSNALPDWSSDSVTHNITIGCHIDNKYNPEVNIALKKLNNAYITPIEENGETLPEEVTTTKNWTLTIQWNGVAGSSADEMIDDASLEYSTVTLPENYTRCLYLQSDGTQYIDTEYMPTDSTGIWNSAKMIGDTEAVAVGCVTNSTYVYVPRWCGSSVTGFYGWGTTYSLTDKGNKGHHQSSLNFLNNRKAILDVPSISKNYTKDLVTLTTTPSHSLYIFGRNNNGSLNQPWNGRIYRVKITEGDQVVRDFIPCLNPSGKPCMYDVINGVEYINQGTGADFTYELYQG